MVQYISNHFMKSCSVSSPYSMNTAVNNTDTKHSSSDKPCWVVEWDADVILLLLYYYYYIMNIISWCDAFKNISGWISLSSQLGHIIMHRIE